MSAIHQQQRRLKAWFGLLVYLFLGLLSPQGTFAASSAMAGEHTVSVTSQGQVNRVVFCHEKIQASALIQPILSAEQALNNHSGSSTHLHRLAPHPDHQILLPASQEDALLTASTFSISPEAMSQALEIVDTNWMFPYKRQHVYPVALAQPPPFQASTPHRLKTIILLL